MGSEAFGPPVLAVDDGLVQGVGGEDEAVDGDQLLAGSELGLVGGAAPADVVDGAVGAELEAERVPDEGSATAATAAGLCISAVRLSEG